MAQANITESDYRKSLTDCENFLNGHCRFGKTCRYRHCFEARKQLEICSDWPDLCCRIQCQFQHPALLPKPRAILSNSPTPSASKDSVIAFFWDIENVPIPRGQRPFDIVQRIRQKLITEPGSQEVDFSCYCNSSTISQQNQQSLQHANVRIIHVPDRKPGAADRQILLDLDRFERVHRPPATIVLISGDIDFVGKLSDLRHRVRFHVIVIHNKPAKEELKATVNEHYPWTLFTHEQTNSSNRKPYSNNNRMQSRTPISDSRNYNNYIDRNLAIPSASPPNLMQQRSKRTEQQPQAEPAPLFTSDLNQTSFPVYYYNPNDIVPPYPFSSGMLPATPVHQPTTYSNVETNNIQYRPMRQGDNRINRNKRRERNTPQECAFCDAEFNTISALRQHQEDKGHVFACSMCNQGFFTQEGQMQHRIAKGHNLDEDEDASNNRSTVSSTNSVEEPSPGIIIARSFVQIMREIFK
jgi:hypothetical protein